MKTTKLVNDSVVPVEDEFAAGGFQEGLNEYKRFWIERALEKTGGNQLRAAELLGINRNTLKKYITSLGISITKARQARH
jgi:two-component system nitrogen regulation response regulator GlnG